MIKSQMLKSLKVNFPTHIVLCDQEMYYTHGTSFMCRAFGTCVVRSARVSCLLYVQHDKCPLL